MKKFEPEWDSNPGPHYFPIRVKLNFYRLIKGFKKLICIPDDNLFQFTNNFGENCHKIEWKSFDLSGIRTRDPITS